MKEKIEQRVQSLREGAERKSQVVRAAIYAVQESSLLHKMGAAVEKSAIEALTRDVNEYMSTGASENISDLRNIAQDAAEGVFREFGFDSPEIVSDFNTALDEQLRLPEASQ